NNLNLFNYKKNSKISFRGGKFLPVNQIEANINRGILQVKNNTINAATKEEIKQLIKDGKEIIYKKSVSGCIKEYGAGIGEKIAAVFLDERKEFFFGKNPNFNLDNMEFEDYINQIKTLSEDEKILLIKDVANVNNGKYLYFWRKNPDKLLMFVNHTHYLPEQLENFNVATWDAIFKSFISIFNSNSNVDIIDSIYKYARSGYANEVNFVPYEMQSEFVKKITDNLKKIYITANDNNIQLCRDDDAIFFSDIHVENAKLSDLIRNLRYDRTNVEKILKFFNNFKPEIKRNMFLSTSIKPHEFAHKAIKWNLTLQKGVKYLYIEPLKMFSSGEEAELLVHPCRIKINNADYANYKLIIDADILP
ncbi:TPA: hypothetical protein CPT94_00005, partial [Candidatus Gastranaerophilales bacterium HUM_22]